MSTIFWIKRFFTVLAGAFVVIGIAQALKGHSWPYSASQGAIWGLIAATVFVVARFFQARRGQHCAVCRDTPEMQRSHRHDA